jgi:hypothetical protein
LTPKQDAIATTDVPSPRAASVRAILSAAAAAGLLPFQPRDSEDARAGLLPQFATAAAATVAALRNAGVRAVKRLPISSDGGTPRPPKAPVGPPGNAGAGGVAGAGGIAGFGVWCAILLCCVLYLAQELRRHRIRLSLPTPSGVVLLLHRPG